MTPRRRIRLLAAAVLVAAVVIPAPDADADTSVLDSLTVAPLAPITGYSRAQFGPAWTDNNNDPWGHNHCDTRDDVLARDLTQVVRDGCKVESGMLLDPYTGNIVPFHRGPHSTDVQIDHVVALGDAWQTGAAAWPESKRVDFANDPIELLAVSGPPNEAKGDRDASQWLPPSVAFRCAYVNDQIAVKSAYHLWVTPAEKAAMAAVLATC